MRLWAFEDSLARIFYQFQTQTSRGHPEHSIKQERRAFRSPGGTTARTRSMGLNMTSREGPSYQSQPENCRDGDEIAAAKGRRRYTDHHLVCLSQPLPLNNLTYTYLPRSGSCSQNPTSPRFGSYQTSKPPTAFRDLLSEP